MEAISHRVIGRMGGLLFLAAGLVSIVQSALPSVARFNAEVHAGLGLAAVALAILCWFLPWQRWPRSRTLWLGPIGLILLGATAGFGGFNDFSYGCYFLVVFVWIGVTQPRHTSLWFLPLTGAIYLIPIWYRQREAYALTSVFEVLAMCALVGESLGWVSQHLRRAEALETRRLWDMQGLLKAGDRLARQTEAGEAAAVASDLATQLLRAAAAVVLLPDDGDTLIVGGSARWPGVEAGTRISRADASTAFAAMRATEPVVFPETGLPSALATRARDGCTLVLVPLRGVGTVQGVLVVDIAREDATLDRFDEDMAMSFGTQAGLMLERLHSVEALMSDATGRRADGPGQPTLRQPRPVPPPTGRRGRDARSRSVQGAERHAGGTRQATTCSARSARTCARCSARETPPSGTAATSSSSCCEEREPGPRTSSNGSVRDGSKGPSRSASAPASRCSRAARTPSRRWPVRTRRSIR